MKEFSDTFSCINDATTGGLRAAGVAGVRGDCKVLHHTLADVLGAVSSTPPGGT